MNKIKVLKKIGLLLIGILMVQLVFAQKNYVPGYVIQNTTDTLFGLVDYREWKYNPDNIRFKKDIESKPISFHSTEISEFKAGGEIYVSGIIDTEITPTQTARLTEKSQINIKLDTAFLQTLFKGEKSLYFYKNADGRENFYINQGTDFDLLIYKKYITKQDGKRIIMENKKYLRQLSVYLNDCETINSKIEQTLYEQNSLLKLFRRYYKCAPSNIDFQKEFEKIRTDIGVLAGVSSTSLVFGSEAFDYLVEAGFPPSIDFSGGVYFDLVLPRNQGKWSIYNEILFSTYKAVSIREEYVSEQNFSETTVEIGQSSLKVNNMARFKYPIGSLYLFLNAGISNGFAISETNYGKRDATFFLVHEVQEGLALNDTRTHEQSLMAGIGLKYDRFSLDIRYEQGNGMSEYTNLNSTTKRYYFLLGYRF